MRELQSVRPVRDAVIIARHFSAHFGAHLTLWVLVDLDLDLGLDVDVDNPVRYELSQA